MSGDLRGELVSLQRELHRIPELFFREKETGRFLQNILGGFSTPVPIARTGCYVDLGPADAELTLLLRADMDGLPITEESELPWRSTLPGQMHACGHDAHMAALVVAGRLLSQAPPHGLRVRLLFQPAEEAGGGAQACIDAGVLDGVDAAFGIHIWNELPIGTVALTHGGIMAGVVEFTCTIQGRGGHGAIPHRTADPVVAAAQLVTALQTIASRFTSPLEPVVVSVGSIHAGDAFNVIPDSAELKGTVRTFSLAEQDAVEAHLRAIANGVGIATDTRINVEWSVHAIPTVNDPAMCELVRKSLDRMTGLKKVLTDYRTMAGEDFGELARKVPACFALVGSGNADKGLTEPHHSPRFAFDDDVLTLACDLHRAVAAEFAETGEYLAEG
ncbi:MAG: amidohydrolase [Deltaproteobacteria bacterium HGW-Deltaproteobacteria-14]|jgi:amidohydrolase|nr:MAG: amidohydrolase [Deltaproteobacteria bacterium HGW-Deltaproteobacteria-14]